MFVLGRNVLSLTDDEIEAAYQVLHEEAGQCHPAVKTLTGAGYHLDRAQKIIKALKEDGRIQLVSGRGANYTLLAQSKKAPSRASPQPRR